MALWLLYIFVFIFQASTPLSFNSPVDVFSSLLSSDDDDDGGATFNNVYYIALCFCCDNRVILFRPPLLFLMPPPKLIVVTYEILSRNRKALLAGVEAFMESCDKIVLI